MPSGPGHTNAKCRIGSGFDDLDELKVIETLRADLALAMVFTRLALWRIYADEIFWLRFACFLRSTSQHKLSYPRAMAQA